MTNTKQSKSHGIGMPYPGVELEYRIGRLAEDLMTFEEKLRLQVVRNFQQKAYQLGRMAADIADRGDECRWPEDPMNLLSGWAFNELSAFSRIGFVRFVFSRTKALCLNPKKFGTKEIQDAEARDKKRGRRVAGGKKSRLRDEAIDMFVAVDKCRDWLKDVKLVIDDPAFLIGVVDYIDSRINDPKRPLDPDTLIPLRGSVGED